MGQEILYCSKCKTQLRTSDFENEKAYRVNGIVSCYRCARDIVHALPPETIKQLLGQISTQEELAEKKNSSTSRILKIVEIDRAKIITRRAVTGTQSIPGWVLGAAAASVLVLGALLAAFLSPSGSTSGARDSLAPREHKGPGAEQRPAARETAGPAPVVGTPAPESATVESEAREVLRRARELARTAPQDLVGQIAVYELAVRVSAGTSFEEPARRELEEIRKKDADLASRELPTLLDQVRAARDKEDFGFALQSLEQSRRRHAGTDWTGSLEKEGRELRERAAALYGPLKEKALAAARKPAPEDVKLLRERIGTWGMPEFQKDLEKELNAAGTAAVPAPTPVPPKPSSSPAAEAFEKAWRAALHLAGARDYDAAIRDLQMVSADLGEAPLREEARADLELLRAVAAFHAEALQILSKSPKGQKLSLASVDESGRPREIAGLVIRAGPFRLDLNKDDERVEIYLGEILAKSLVELRRSRGEKGPGHAAALMCLFEGDLETARALQGEAAPPIPEKYWAYGSALAQKSLDPQAGGAKREQEARSLFHAANRASGSFTTAVNAAQMQAALLKEFGDTTFVGRNRACIVSLSQGGREYFFGPERMNGGGTFSLSNGKKPELYWASAADSPAALRKDNFVQLEYSAFPDLEYRCWVYAGGCCAETMTCFAQGTEFSLPHPQTRQPMPLEPGTDAGVPVKHSVANSIRTHAGHGGPKQASRWGWIQVPLPKYGAPGPKVVRLLTDQQGFSVAYAFVSALKSAPPRETEFKDFEALYETPRPKGVFYVAMGAPAMELQAPMTKGKIHAEGSISGAPVFSTFHVGPGGALPPDQDKGGWVTLTIDLPKEGEWFLWARLYYPGGALASREADGSPNDPNSLYARIDGGKERVLGNMKEYGRWHWSSEKIEGACTPMALGVLSKGRHLLRIRCREAVITPTLVLSPQLDMICLSPEKKYVPNDKDARK